MRFIAMRTLLRLFFAGFLCCGCAALDGSTEEGSTSSAATVGLGAATGAAVAAPIVAAPTTLISKLHPAPPSAGIWPRPAQLLQKLRRATTTTSSAATTLKALREEAVSTVRGFYSSNPQFSSRPPFASPSPTSPSEAKQSLQDGKKCDFECAAAGVVGYFVCAAACVASLKPAEALGCITLGCPPMVAAATEGCLKVNPECVKDEQELVSGRGTKQLEQPATLSSGASTRKAIVQGLVQEGVAGVLQDKKLLDLDGRTKFAKDIMGGKFDSAANQFLAEALKMQQEGEDTMADAARSEMDADPVYV